MKETKNNNVGMKVLSVFIAALIWLLVANINDPTVKEKFSGIEVTVVNEDALTDLGYAYEIVEGDEVTVTVEGKKSIVSTLTASDFQAVADFSKLSEVDAVPIDVSVDKYSNELELSLGSVNTMKITKDEVVSVSLPVNVVVEGEPAEGYAVGSVTGTPNLVKVTGPENLLTSAKEIRAEVDIDGIMSDVSTTAVPVLYDEDGEMIDSSQIKMETLSIGVTITLWATKTVDVIVDTDDEPASGYVMTAFEYEPKSVVIAAPDDVLEDLTSITLPSVSLDGLTEDYEEDIVLSEDLLPKNVILADDTTDIKVKVTIESVTNRTISFTSSGLTIKGRKKRTVTFDSGNTYSLIVEGGESIIKDLSISDFSPWIDITDLEEGEHTVAVHVKDVDGVTVVSTGEITITIAE
ncbi:MAG: hypothetical protein LUF92_00085 [Clostridiales bacterium]|nr:hypothetical protein [Clostridiales bacterium]